MPSPYHVRAMRLSAKLKASHWLWTRLTEAPNRSERIELRLLSWPPRRRPTSRLYRHRAVPHKADHAKAVGRRGPHFFKRGGDPSTATRHHPVPPSQRSAFHMFGDAHILAPQQRQHRPSLVGQVGGGEGLVDHSSPMWQIKRPRKSFNSLWLP